MTMKINKKQAKKILASMPEGATHFWVGSDEPLYIYDTYGNVIMRYYEKWKTFPDSELFEWNISTNTWRYSNANTRPELRLSMDVIKKIAAGVIKKNADRLDDIESAIKLLKEAGYIIYKPI